MSAFSQLMDFQRGTEALAQIAGRLGWDQETMMPRGAAEQRGEEMAAILQFRLKRLEAMRERRQEDPEHGQSAWMFSNTAAAPMPPPMHIETTP